MTSEICVMNRMSVVLAADSASTITYFENGERVQRYFKGANKVFQLSEHHPVGLMIYGNAEIHGVPWELAIKAFRKHLKSSSFDTIAGYATAFEQFLNDNEQLFPEDLRDSRFCDAIELGVATSCRDFDDNKKQNPDFDENAHLQLIQNGKGEIEFKNGLDGDTEDQLLAHWPKVILQNLRDDNNFYSKFLGERTDEELLRIIGLSISLKVRELPSNPTGLVFAGYGNQSIYPEIFVSKSAGFVARQFILAEHNSVVISQDNNSFISGFAQASMADTFIIGFDSQVYETINQVQEQTFPDVLAPFAALLGAKVQRTPEGVVMMDHQDQIVADEATFGGMMRTAFKDVGGNIMMESRQQHGEPLERVISMLPVEEMAELAATMVDLQSLKEKVTRPSETVGGPVDVAIITKNEGLVWKKRKHFFDADINRRYLQRLQSSD